MVREDRLRRMAERRGSVRGSPGAATRYVPVPEGAILMTPPGTAGLIVEMIRSGERAAGAGTGHEDEWMEISGRAGSEAGRCRSRD